MVAITTSVFLFVATVTLLIIYFTQKEPLETLEFAYPCFDKDFLFQAYGLEPTLAQSGYIVIEEIHFEWRTVGSEVRVSVQGPGSKLYELTKKVMTYIIERA